MSNISISTPFLRGLVHAEVALTTAKVSILAPANGYDKRILTLIQNKSASVTISVVGNATDTIGIAVPPLSNISIDNYNGGLWAFANSGTATVHIATSSV